MADEPDAPAGERGRDKAPVSGPVKAIKACTRGGWRLSCRPAEGRAVGATDEQMTSELRRSRPTAAARSSATARQATAEGTGQRVPRVSRSEAVQTVTVRRGRHPGRGARLRERVSAATAWTTGRRSAASCARHGRQVGLGGETGGSGTQWVADERAIIHLPSTCRTE